jgi:hypothetical protein
VLVEVEDRIREARLSQEYACRLNPCLFGNHERREPAQNVCGRTFEGGFFAEDNREMSFKDSENNSRREGHLGCCAHKEPNAPGRDRPPGARP